MSSAYHPQTDGQTERVNQCMETYLRCFVSACPHKWVHWIYLAEFWYNATWHSALGFSPFEVLYGYKPRHFGVDLNTACPVNSLQEWLHEKTVMQQLVQQHLARAQQRMKSQADKNRVERQFSVGDMVFLKIQPYVQSSLAPRANQKLAFRFFGPFPVVAKVGAVAYKLGLPSSSSVHPVFHVSQLKKAIPSAMSVAQLPKELYGFQVPQHVLQKRIGADGKSQVLVQWSSMPPSLATWEDSTALRQAFPQAPAWGQAGFLRRGSVSSVAPGLEFEEVGRPSDKEDEAGPKKGGRIRKPSVRVSGPDWVTA